MKKNLLIAGVLGTIIICKLGNLIKPGIIPADAITAIVVVKYIIDIIKLCTEQR
jgi:hypothetical protein